jgi:hypothetical protein
MRYIRPQDVTAPKSHLELIRILDEGGEGTTAVGLGWWHEKKRGKPRSRVVLLLRWNGWNDPIGEESVVGVPSSRGYPTWFVLEEKFYEPILLSKLLDDETVEYARRVLQQNRR